MACSTRCEGRGPGSENRGRVWAEVRAHFPSDQTFQQALGAMGVRFEPLTPAAAAAAGRLWRAHRQGKTLLRDRVVADFLIGAHALLQADALLTRDRGYYRRCFRGLRVVDPSEA